MSGHETGGGLKQEWGPVPPGPGLKPPLIEWLSESKHFSMKILSVFIKLLKNYPTWTVTHFTASKCNI